jgi:hypothetical protein
MRNSVSSWPTTKEDVEASLKATIAAARRIHIEPAPAALGGPM